MSITVNIFIYCILWNTWNLSAKYLKQLNLSWIMQLRNNWAWEKKTLKYNSRYIGYIRHRICCSLTMDFISNMIYFDEWKCANHVMPVLYRNWNLLYSNNFLTFIMHFLCRFVWKYLNCLKYEIYDSKLWQYIFEMDIS